MEEKQEEFDLPKEYENFKIKYEFLPQFNQISEDFDIEKLQEKESSYLLREIRRVISEKISAYMHFFETIINPSAPPLFVFSVIKGMDKRTKNKNEEIYKKLAKFQIESMKLDTVYSEEKEAGYISRTFKEWQIIKEEIYRIIEILENKIDDTQESIKGNYFG